MSHNQLQLTIFTEKYLFPLNDDSIAKQVIKLLMCLHDNSISVGLEPIEQTNGPLLM